MATFTCSIRFSVACRNTLSRKVLQPLTCTPTYGRLFSDDDKNYFAKRRRRSSEEFRRSINNGGYLKNILEASPKTIQPYFNLIRFDRPIGTYLLYSPCTWSIALAASAGCLPNMKMLLIFGLGSFVMRSAGCVINDMWDSDYDKRVSESSLISIAS